MPFGALQGDLYSMSSGNRQASGALSIGPAFTLPDNDRKDGEKRIMQIGGSDSFSSALERKPENQPSYSLLSQQQSSGLMQQDIDTVNNIFSLWFGDKYRMDEREQQTFERMVSASADPVDAAGRYVSSLAISKRSGLPLKDVYANLDTISMYYTGNRYRPSDASFGELVDASFMRIESSDLKRKWMKTVQVGGVNSPEALELEQRIALMDAEIEAKGGGIPKGGWDKLKNDVLGSLGYTADVASHSLLASTATAAATGGMVAKLSALNPIAGVTAGITAGLYSTYAGAVAGFNRSRELAEADMYWTLMHQADAEGNPIAGDSEAAAIFSGLYGNAVGFMETMFDGITSRASTALSGSVSRRFGISNLATKVLTDRGVQGTLENIAYAGLDWLAGGLDEGFLQEAPQQLAETLLTAGYQKTIGMNPDLSVKEVAADFFRTGLESTLVGLVYGGAGIPGTMINNSRTSFDLRRTANVTPSEEVYFERTNGMKPEGVAQADFDKARSEIYAAAKAKREEIFGNIQGTVNASEEMVQEERYDTTDPETGEETSIVPDGSVYRDPETNRLYTETREENGRKRVYAGDRNTRAVYGYAEVSTDGETLSVGSVRVRPGYEGIREELVRETISSQRTGESNISWEPVTEGLQRVRDNLVRNNPRGENAGLDYGADFSLNQDHDIDSLTAQIKAAMPSLSREESVVAARLYSIADSDNQLSSLNNGEPVRNSDTLPARYRGAADSAKAIIYAGQNADFSTFYHELFHVNAAQRPSDARNLSNSIRSSLQDEASRANLLKFIEESKEIWGNGFNADNIMQHLEAIPADSDASQWSREQFEDLARLAEAYASADNSRRTTLPEAIRNILRKIADYMRRIYQTVTHTVSLPKEITDAYDAIMYKSSKKDTAANSDIYYQEETKKMFEKYSSRIKDPESWKGKQVREFFRKYRADITEAIKEYPKVRMNDVLLLKGMAENDMPFQKELLQSILASDILGTNIILLPRFGTNFLNNIFGVDLRKGSLADGLAALADGDRYIEFKAVNEENLVRRLNEASKEADIGFIVVDDLSRRGRRKLLSSHSQFRLPDGFVSYIVSLSDNAIYLLSNKNKELSLELLADRPERISTLEELSSTLKEYLHGPQSSRTFEPISYNSYLQAEPTELMYQSAYHGSPYTFTEFSTDHMGEGAGRQDYGWGLYFTDVEEYARGYADRSRTADNIQDDIERLSAGIQTANARLAEAQAVRESMNTDGYWESNEQYQEALRNGPSSARFAITRRRYENATNEEYAEAVKNGIIEGADRNIRIEESSIRDMQRRLSEAENTSPQTRNLYTVELPDNARWLDINETVPRSLVSAVMRIPAVRQGIMDNWGSLEDYRSAMLGSSAMGFYNDLAMIVGSDREASLILNRTGITGLRYPANSIAESNGTGPYNYVVFNPSDAVITDYLMYQDARTPDTSDLSQEQNEQRKKAEEADKAYQNNSLPTQNRSETEMIFASNAEEAENHLRKLQGREIVNANDGSRARISSTTIGKLLSNKALNKSLANGFTRAEHDTAAANIDILFRNAIRVETRADRNNSPDIKAIHTYETGVEFEGSGRNGIAEILIKESVQNGQLIYTLELAELKSRDPSASRLGDSSDEPARSQGLSTVKLSSSAPNVNLQNSLEGFYDEYDASMEGIGDVSDAEEIARIYSEWAVEADTEAMNDDVSLIDEDVAPYFDENTVNLLPDGSIASTEAEYENAMDYGLITEEAESRGAEASNPPDIQEAPETGSNRPGISYDDAFDYELTWKQFVDRNKPDVDWGENTTDAEKDDIFVRAIQDNDTLLRYLGIIGESLYLNTRQLNEDWHFSDQIQRERIKSRVFDVITNTSIRNASLTALKAELTGYDLTPRMKSLIRREMADNTRFYRNILSWMLRDERMKPESVVKDVQGLDIPSRDTLDAMPINELRALAETAEDKAIVNEIERGTLMVTGGEDERRAKEINEAITSLASQIKDQETELSQNEKTISRLEIDLDKVTEALSERDRNISSLIQTLRTIEAITNNSDKKLSGQYSESYALNDRMKKIVAEMSWLKEEKYDEIESQHLKGRNGKYEIPKAKRAAREEYISSLLSFYPGIFTENGNNLGKLDGIRDIYSPSGFSRVQEVLEKRREELRTEWKNEASSFASRLANSTWTSARKLASDIDSALDKMESLNKEIERQKKLRDRVKDNRARQVFDARTEERWKAAKKALEAEKKYNQEIQNWKSYAQWQKHESRKQLESAVRKAKDDAALLADWMKAQADRRIADLKKEQREKRQQERLYRRIRAEKEKLARSIMRPVNLSSTDYETAGEAIAAIQALIDPVFRRDWTYDIVMNPDGEAGENTMSIEDAKAYLDGLREDDRNWTLSILSPDLAARLSGERKPLNDWTVEELRMLAQQVESLRKRGREVLSAKKAYEREIRQGIQKAIINAVKEAGKRSGRDSGDTLPGTVERVKQAQGTLAKFRSFKYITMRMQEIAQLLDGGLGHRGAAYQLLVDEKRYHQQREWVAVDQRTAKIAPYLTKEAVKNLFDQVVINYNDGLSQTYTVDNLAYIYLSQFDDDSMAAVAYGNLLTDTEKGTLLNKGHIDENGKFIPEAMSPGTIIDNDQLKALGDRRFHEALAVAEKELKERNLMELVDVIRDDFSDPENFRRLNSAAIETYNTPLKRVTDYLPIMRTDLRGEKFRNDMADTLFNLNTGDFNAAIDKGMTISRTAISPRHQRGVDLSLLGVWQKSVRNQEHLIEFAGYAKKTRGVFGNSATELISTVDRVYSPALMKEVQGYIDYVIDPYSGRRSNTPNLDKVIRNLRGRVGSAYLGWKLPGIVLQFTTSAWPFLQDMSPVTLLRGYLKIASDRGAALNFIYEKSPMMKHRTMNTVLQEALERRGDITSSKARRAMNRFEEVGQLGLSWTDKIMVAGGWLGAYEKSLQDNLDAGMDTALADAAAVKTADDIVLRVQPAGDSTELPSLFRSSSELMKIFLQFQSSLSVIWNNLIWDNIGFARNRQFGKIVGSIVAYGMAGLALGLIADGFDDDDDAKDRALKMGYWFLTQGVESVPVFGSDISLMLQRAITGERDYYGNGVDMFPGITKVFSGIEDIVASDKPFLEGVSKIAEGAGIFVGAPVSGLKNLKRVASEGPAAFLGR